MVRTILFSLALMFALHSAAHAQVAWKFTPGERFYVHEASKVTANVDLEGGHGEKALMRVDLLRAVEVLNVTAEGGVVLRETIEAMRVRDGNNPQGESAGPLEGAELVFEYDKDMKVVSLSGYDELVSRLAGALGSDEDTIRAAFPKEELIRSFGETYNIYLPGRAVSRGDQWNAVRTVNGPPVGKLSMDLTYTAEGMASHQDRDVLRIAFAAKSSAQGVQQGPIRADLDRIELTGDVLFSSEQGKLAQLNLRGTIEGIMTIEDFSGSVSGQLHVELEQTITVSETRPEI